MCIIAYVPKGVKMDKEYFTNCWENNPDGAGMMYAINGKLRIKKPYFSPVSFWRDFCNIARVADGGVALHFRITTSGLNNKENTHPHKISPKHGLMHNGVLSEYHAKSKKQSDTVLFCNQLSILPMETFDCEIFHDLLAAYAVENASSFLLMNNYSTVLLLGVGWETEDGVSYSNTTYKYSTRKYGFYSQSTKKKHCIFCGDFIKDGVCEYCGEQDGGFRPMFCADCGSILDKGRCVCCHKYQGNIRTCSMCDVPIKAGTMCPDCEEYYNLVQEGKTL